MPAPFRPVTVTSLSFTAVTLAGLIVCAIGVCAVVPTAFAQGIPGATPAQNDLMQPAQPGGGWSNEKFERQEFREEMEKIRHEHEELEAARDKLLDQCVNVTGDKAADCEKQKQALHDWHDRLHDRLRLLHEKMEAAQLDRTDGINGPMVGDAGNNWAHTHDMAQPTGAPAPAGPQPGLSATVSK
jgi:hypothetical protein